MAADFDSLFLFMFSSLEIADTILAEQADFVGIPGGVPTFEEIEMRRQDHQADDIARPNQVFL